MSSYLYKFVTTTTPQEAVLAVFASELFRDKWKVRNPDEPSHKTGLGGIQEPFTGEGLPL